MATFKQFLEDQGVSETQFKALKVEEVIKLQNDYVTQSGVELEKAKQEVSDALKGAGEAKTEALKATQEAEAAKTEAKEATEKVTKLETSLKAISEELEVVKTKGGKPETKDVLQESIEKAFEEKIKSRDKGSKQPISITLKAPTTTASIADNTRGNRVPELGIIARARLTFAQVFPIKNLVPADGNQVIFADYDENTSVLAASAIAEGGTYDESTARWMEVRFPLRKLGVQVPASEEIMRYQSMFANDLNRFVTEDVALEEDDQILNGDGTGQNYTGLLTAVPTYTAPDESISNATIYDLVIRMRSAIEIGKRSRFAANAIIMHQNDVDKLLTAKDANNNPILPFYVTVSDDGSNMSISGMRVIITSMIAENNLVVCDTTKATIWRDGNITVDMNYSGTQYVEDMITIKARQHGLFVIRNVDKGAFRKVTNITTALASLTA